MKLLTQKYQKILNEDEPDDWEDDDMEEEIEYITFNGISLKKDEVYIQIDGEYTYWQCIDKSEGFMVYRDVREVKIEGDRLTLIFHHTKKQVFFYDHEYMFYDKQLAKKP